MEEVGETDLEPEAMGVMAPTPWLMVPVVALALVHERVDDCPLVMESGVAVRVQEGVPGVVAFARYG